MQLSAKEAWKRILDEAHRELPDHTIRTWLEPTEAIALDEGRLIVGAPDQFAVEWNETKHATLLSRLAEPVLGQPTSVVFRVHEDRQKRPQMDFFVAPAAPAAARPAPVNPQHPAAQRALHLRHLRHRQVQRARGRRGPRGGRGPGQDLQPALHLRRHRAGQDPPDAGHRPRRLRAAARDPGALRRRRAVHQRGHREHPQPHHAGVPAPLPRPTWTSSWWTTCISWKARR